MKYLVSLGLGSKRIEEIAVGDRNAEFPIEPRPIRDRRVREHIHARGPRILGPEISAVLTSQIFPVVDVQGKEAEPLSYVRFINLDRLLTSDWDVAEGSRV